MKRPFSPQRRRFLKLSALAGASILLPGLSGCASLRSAFRPPDPDWRSWPLERKAAQMLMIGFRGEAVTPDSPIAVAIRDIGIGGVVLFDNSPALGLINRNITGPAQVKALNTSLHAYARTPLFVAVDQEGGEVCRLKQRYGFPPSVSARYLGERNNPGLTCSEGEKIAIMLRECGFNLNLSPVVDLMNPENPIIARKERSFSADPGVVSAQAGAYIAGHHRQRIATCLKHFPGHGSSRQDTHLDLVDVTAYWQENELYPYQALIKEGFCDIVMTGHLFNRNIDPDYPATLSRATIQGLLRQRLGYGGVVLSDDLKMGAIQNRFSFETAVEKAVNAGVDLLLAVALDREYDPDQAAKSVDLLMKLVASGRIDRGRIDEACGRIMALKGKYLVG